MDNDSKSKIEALKARVENKDKGKSDPYMTAENPKACIGLTPAIVHHILGSDAFTEACRGGFIKQNTGDRVIVDFGGRKFKHDVDCMEIRTSEFPNLVTVSFLKGGIAATESFKKATEADPDITFEEAKPAFVKALGDVPAHRNCGGFYAVSVFHGVMLGEVIDLVRTQTGMEIKVDPEWDASRIEYNTHVTKCDCPACRDTIQNRATLRKTYPELRPEGEKVTTLFRNVRLATVEDFTKSEAIEAANKQSVEVAGTSSVN